MDCCVAWSDERLCEAGVERPGGVELFVRRWDPPAGIATVGRVIVVHGLGEHSGRYRELAEGLGLRGWRVVAYDQRGHGRSPGRRGVLRDIAPLLDDLAAMHDWVCDQVPAPGAPLVFGHSMGGLVTLRTLQTRPVRCDGAVLSAPWLATALRPPAWKRMLQPLLGRLAPDGTVRSPIRAWHLTRDPDEASAWRRDPLVHDRVSAGLIATIDAAQSAALADPPPTQCPLLLLLPTDDPVTDIAPVRTWARRGSPDRVRVELLPGRRHEPHHDLGRAEVFDLIADQLLAGRQGG